MNIDKDIEILEDVIKNKDCLSEEDYKSIENVLSDLETWKKIAEKLAEILQILILIKCMKIVYMIIVL